MEEFRDIKGYEGLYQVSNLGRVKSLKFNKERILKHSISTKGYLFVKLYNSNNKNSVGVHQLVAQEFLGHTRCGMIAVVNHINFIVTDNRVKNLEVTTPRENGNKKHLLKDGRCSGVGRVSNRFRARISINGKQVHLGYFSTKHEASLAYEKATKEIT